MKRTASSHTATLRAKGLQVLAEEPLPPIQRPTLEYRAVTDADRFEALEKLASSIAGWGKTSGWSTPRRQLVTARAHRTVNVNAGIVVMPEGYGKSSLVLHLIANGFKIVFCTKSNAQLLEKERELTVGWRDQPEQVRGIIGRPPKVTKFISKAQNLQARLESLGVDAGTLKISSYELENPYGVAGLDEGQTIADLAALFQARGIDLDAEEFFQTHYNEFKKPAVDGRNANITLITFAALQACCNNPHRRWWEVLGLIASVRTVYSHDRDKLLKISVPFERIAVIFDDPDRDDVDWLRGISQETAVRFMQNRSTVSDRRIAMETPSFWMKKFESVEAERLAALTAAANEKRRATPVHEIIKVQGSWWVKRPKKQTVGYRLRDRCKAKVIVTTTEILTAAYAYHSLTRNKLKVDQHIKLFRANDCNVTAISTAITRGAAHAVLLPIIELLKEEFPTENVTLIADGLGCRFNLSNSKGRNSLKDRTTVIKLSWPHPEIVAKTMAHLGDIDSYDGMVATLLGDLANQALGRNQGFRYQGRQAIVLIDPRWYPAIVGGDVLRYRLNPWSTELPSFNKKTSKKSVREAIQMSDEQSALERRLIELIHDFRKFGLSDEATRLAQKLPDRQQKLFQKWRDEALAEAPALELAQIKRKADVKENVRRFRERQKADRQIGLVARAPIPDPVAPN